MDFQGRLTIKDLMNYQYCKRLIYFENILRIPQVTTIKELKGREVHKDFSRKSKRNKIIMSLPKLPKEYGLNLESKELNFRTVLDCLFIDKENNIAIPLEYKNTKKPEKLYNTFKIQIFAECLLIKSILGYEVPFAFIKFNQIGDIVKLHVNEFELLKVKKIINEINELLKTELIPEPTQFVKRCKDCCYWKICRRA